VIPVYALVLPAVAEAVTWALRRGVGARAASWIAAALLLALAAHDFDPTWRHDEALARSQLFFKACRAAERSFEPDDVLASDFGAHFSAELDRPVYTLRWSLKRGGVPGALDFIVRYGVTGVVLDRTIPSNVRLADELLSAHARPLASVGPYVLLDLLPE